MRNPARIRDTGTLLSGRRSTQVRNEMNSRMSRMRVGVMDSALAARPTVDALTRASYMSAVANRVDSFWVPDHLNALFPRSIWAPKYSGAARLAPRADASMEPWTMLGHLAARNRLGRLRLGVSVTDTGRRNPAVTAQAAATLHLLSRGRAILGIGTGEREGNEPYGVDWSKPVARFEEALATIRALWNSGGELVNRDSPFFPLRNAVFSLRAGLSRILDERAGVVDPIDGAQKIVGGRILHAVDGHRLAVNQRAKRVGKRVADSASSGWLSGAAREHHLHIRAGRGGTGSENWLIRV
jgi:hypothetical protein